MAKDASLDRVLGEIAKLRERRLLADELRRLVEPLREGNLEAVEGESELLTDLEAHLEEAFKQLEAIKGGAHDQGLEAMTAALDDVSWEIASELLPDLRAKFERQTALLKQVGADLKVWDTQLKVLDDFLENASRDGARFSRLDEDLAAAKSVVTSIKSQLADRLYGALPGLRETARTTMEKIVDSVEKAKPQVQRVRNLVKQADLLIMQVAAGENEYEYRVLLRSADRLLTRGINIIQDVRKVSRQDRDWMLQQLAQLTTSSNEARSAVHRAASAPAAAGAARTITAAEPTCEQASANAALALDRLSEFMFQMVIPSQMQTCLKKENWSFSITTNDLELPWELIGFHDDATGELRYLCLERSVSRMPLGEVFPLSFGRRAQPAKKKRRMLLIHSDPDGNLPAAAREVDTIAQELQDEVEFERVQPADATNAHLNNVLMGESFDFIHYAGHAYFDRNEPNRSGLQLKDSRLTADKIRRLSKGGSLVFLNACESGTVARENEPQKVSYLLNNPEPVVGLASAFVYSGAIGCVGALWPVYDKPAAELAVHFYKNVLRGEPTGEALRLARANVRVSYPREITWAGYVLYGDPTFRLTEN